MNLIWALSCFAFIFWGNFTWGLSDQMMPVDGQAVSIAENEVSKEDLEIIKNLDFLEEWPILSDDEIFSIDEEFNEDSTKK